MIILLLGAPGAGKGTQAELLARSLKLKHLATGDMLRAEVKAGTELGKLAESYMSRGDLVPDDVVIRMIESKLKAADARNGALLDGFPRTTAQAEALDTGLARSGLRVDRAIYLAVSEEELVRRMLGRGRADDTPEAIRRRLVVYRAQTEPVIDYYKGKGRFTEVPGEGAVEDIQKRLARAAS
ncbi:MAG: adenylate kinase [SAR202 cluster bacterium]|nr:adenylate kinase [SAR202 cluster bacterium]